ncbi:MAG: hypothetical protein WC587_01245 [Candidatus Paceibacterota bacterium]
MTTTQKTTTLCFYKTVEKRDDFGKDWGKVFLILKKFLNPEFNVSQTSGGRSGDLWRETVRYALFIGGSKNVWNNGNLGGIYQLTLNSTNGSCQHLSVIIHIHSGEEGKLIVKEVTRVLEEMDFAPKYSYLREPAEPRSSFQKWLKKLVMPITDFKTA